MNRYVRPIMFAFEPDVVQVYSLISFGANGAPTLNTKYSKGVCNFAQNAAISFTGTTTNGNPNVTSVSSFVGLYPGMAVSGTNIPGGAFISTINAGAGTLTLSTNATGANTGLSAVGGAYTITFGAQYSPARFDPYVRLLNFSYSWDESAIPGSASVQALLPTSPFIMLIQNNISNSSLANLVLQMGYFVGDNFWAFTPAQSEQLRLRFDFTRSTAI